MTGRDARTAGKIVEDRTALRRLVAEHQAAGRRVVLTNGVFDLLHVGHARCLEDARGRGEVLVVALNTDASVRSNKGPHRPIVPLAERMELLAGFWFVDLVTAFGEPTADELLRALRPDRYAKGTEYTVATLPERATLAELAIEPVFVGDPKQRSTTDLIARVRAGGC